MNGRIKIVPEIFLEFNSKMGGSDVTVECYRSHRGDFLVSMIYIWGVSLKVEWQPHKSHHHQIRKASNKLVIDSSGFRWEREHVTAAGTVRVCHRVCQGW
jgi:hypothetical protein